MSLLATEHPKIYKLNLHSFQIPHFFLHMWTIANIPKGRAIWPPPPRSLRVKSEGDHFNSRQDYFFVYRLRFILPCKSDCQPIFLKKQGIYSLYAKLWLLRPLIKNIPEPSYRYSSNLTFEASLAFQMREKYVFFFFLELYLKGGK